MWKLPPRHRHCLACQKNLPEEPVYFSALSPSYREQDGQRSDYCSACWHDKLPDAPPCEIYWRGKRTCDAPEPHPNPLHERAVDLLRMRLAVPAAGEEEQPLTYLLALYLERLKTLVLRKTVKAKKQPALQIFERSQNGEIFTVPVVPVDERDQEQLVHLLAGIIDEG